MTSWPEREYDAGKNVFWWRQDEDEAYKLMFVLVNQLQRDQGYHYQNILRNLRYFGVRQKGLLPSEYIDSNLKNIPSGGIGTERIPINLSRSIISTLTSKLTKDKVKITALTNGADWDLQKRAKRLDEFCYGQFYGTKLYNIEEFVFRNCCVFGTGIAKIFEHDGKITVENVFPGEIVVNDVEAVSDSPRSIYQRKWIAREILFAEFPDKKEKIVQAKAVPFRGNTPGLVDMVTITEGWHLPSGEGMDDGRHIMCLENVSLVDEDYTFNYFPFVKMLFDPNPIGWYGTGVPDLIEDVQTKYTKFFEQLYEQAHFSTPYWLVEAGSAVAKAHISNMIGNILEYTGTPPQFVVPQIADPALFQSLNDLYAKAYQLVGVSELSAQSEKPAGLNSGKALREYNDIESERFIILGKAREKFYIECAEHMIDLARFIDERDGNFESLARKSDGIDTIKWSEINLDKDKYVLQIFPTSFFSTTPAARLQEVSELVSAFPQYQPFVPEWLQFPDMKAVNTYVSAPIETVNMLIEKMLEGEPQTPEPIHPLELALRVMPLAYLKGIQNGSPREGLENLLRYMADASELLRMQQQPPAPQPLPQNMPSPGTPSEVAAIENPIARNIQL